MNDKMVSVIVPAYNAEQTLARCLDSIVCQSYPNIEIIVVDDGSKDNTEEIIRNYQKRYGQILSRASYHMGPNAARKVGVNAAKGDYIMFVDADDYINHDAIQIIVDTFRHEDTDIVRFGAAQDISNKKICEIVHDKDHAILDREKAFTILLTSYSLNSLCFQAYRSQLVKKDGVFTQKIHFGEDYLANLNIYQSVQKIALVDDILYFYCENNNSTTRSVHTGRLLKNISCRIYISLKSIFFSRKMIHDRRLRLVIIKKQFRMVGRTCKTAIKTMYNRKKRYAA